MELSNYSPLRPTTMRMIPHTWELDNQRMTNDTFRVERLGNMEYSFNKGPTQNDSNEEKAAKLKPVTVYPSILMRHSQASVELQF